MKIVLFGPVYPFKGRIAHYSCLLYRALCKKHDVSFISYKMQYLKVLYKKGQKNYTNALFKLKPDDKFLTKTALKQESGNPREIAKATKAFFDLIDKETVAENIRVACAIFDWNNFVDRLEEIYT